MEEFSKQKAQELTNLIQGLLREPGWEYMQTVLRRSRQDWEGILRTTAPVGEGAATIARAQGALIVIDQCLLLPQETLRRCLERMSEKEPQE